MNSFFSVPKTTEIPPIVAELQIQQFQQLESAGEGNLFIDKINRTFWFCSDQNLQNNLKFVEHTHNQKVEQANLKSVQAWA